MVLIRRAGKADFDIYDQAEVALLEIVDIIS